MIKIHVPILLTCLFLGACSAGGLGKKSAWQNPNIYKSYSATGNAVLNNGWTSKVDTSGISLNDKHTCTLITRRHVVMAKHYTRSTNSPVIFHDRHGKRISRKLIAVKPAYGDVAVGLLDEPVPSSLRVYPMLTPSADAPVRLRNKHVIVSNQFRQLLIHQIAGVSNGRIYFKFPNDNKLGQGKKIVSGDSGNPSFIMIQGKSILIETHHTGGAGAGPFYGDSNVQAAITRIINETDSTYSIRTIKWYEPDA